MAGDGQVSLGATVIKANARKVRSLGKGDVIGGFAGATADAFTLFERLESKLEQYPGQLTRACVELAKDWRTDRFLRRLEAMMIVADKRHHPGADRHRRRAGARRRRDGHRLGRQLCAGRRQGADGYAGRTPRRSRARRWRSPPRSASTPTPTSSSRRWKAADDERAEPPAGRAGTYQFHPMSARRSAADAARGWRCRTCASGGASRRRSSAISAT